MQSSDMLQASGSSFARHLFEAGGIPAVFQCLCRLNSGLLTSAQPFVIALQGTAASCDSGPSKLSHRVGLLMHRSCAECFWHAERPGWQSRSRIWTTATPTTTSSASQTCIGCSCSMWSCSTAPSLLTRPLRYIPAPASELAEQPCACPRAACPISACASSKPLHPF